MYFILDVLCLVKQRFQTSLVCIFSGLSIQILFDRKYDGNVGKLTLSYWGNYSVKSYSKYFLSDFKDGQSAESFIFQ